MIGYLVCFLFQDTAAELSKCSDSQILPASDYEMYEVRDEEQVNSLLTKFLTLASITRDFEMQKVQNEEQVNTLLAEFMTWAMVNHAIEVQRGKSTADKNFFGETHFFHGTNMPNLIHEEQATFLLTEWLTLASITRDVEMQKGEHTLTS